MQFKILGPLEVTAGGQHVVIGGTRQQTVLGLLLLDANRPVTIERLVDAAYDDDPPTTARAQVQISISTLRRLLTERGRGTIIATRSRGYSIQVPGEHLDAQRFHDLILQARSARDAQRPEEAVASYRRALGLWRGPALEGIDSKAIRVAADRLEEGRLMSTEDCVQLELDLGRHYEVIGELAELVEAHPLRERHRCLLMTALHRCGRDAEALEVYRIARRMMIEELGIEPPKRLQELEHAILTGDGSLDPPPSPMAGPEPATRAGVPRMLPTDIADFTDRAAQIGEIERHLMPPTESERLAVPVVVITGKAGVEKTAVAVHVSHRISGHYPDGQLFADLHGGTSPPVTPTRVLERFLRLLGVPGNALPDAQDERAEIFRAMLAERRMMIVLDNAGAERQVLPLLPGNPASAVIVTSRSRLAGLPGAIHVDLDVFDPETSTELLSRIVGAQRVRDEAEAAADLAALCGRLPLALRIAGARLSAHPHWSVRQLVVRLRNDTRRLDELKHGDMGIRASIMLSYETLGPSAQRLFRRLAILDFPTFSAWVSAAILDCSYTEAQDVLDDLTDAQLVETVDSERGPLSHYRLHDLIRVFARERLAAEDSALERNETLIRVLSSLLFLAESAHRREYGDTYVQPHSNTVRRPLPPELVQPMMASPRAWFERERVNLVSGIQQAARAGCTELCWDLAITAVTLFESRSYLGDWRESHEIALAAVRRARDRRGEAAILYSSGSLGIAEHNFDEARRCLDSALHLFGEIGDDQGAALVLRNLGFLDRLDGRLDDAERGYQQALRTFRSAMDQVGAAYVLHQLAELSLQRDDADDAMRLLAEALRLSRDGGSRRVEAQVLHRMGHTYLLAGEPTSAADAFSQALSIVRDVGDATGEAYALHGLGVARLRQGELGAADHTLRHAAVVAGPQGLRLVEALVTVGLGELALASDDPAHGVDHLREALTLLRELRVPLHEARTLMLLGDAHAASGNITAARQTLADVLPLTDSVDPSTAERLRAEVASRRSRIG